MSNIHNEKVGAEGKAMQVAGPSTEVPGAVVGSKPVFVCQYLFFTFFFFF